MVFKIADLGISLVKNHRLSLSDKDRRLGTPYYLSPEVIRKLNFDERVDIWALGIVAFNLC